MPTLPRKTIERIVQETGRYPLDAFIFVQECIGVAAELVHGPLSETEQAVSRWMAQHNIDLDELRRRWEERKLPPDVLKALQAAGGPEKMNRHVTGQQLCWAVRDAALQRWGLMAQSVLARWSIHRTGDVGAIIFALVGHGWLQKQPTDSPDDFNDVFDFAQAFDPNYHIELN